MKLRRMKLSRTKSVPVFGPPCIAIFVVMVLSVYSNYVNIFWKHARQRTLRRRGRNDSVASVDCRRPLPVSRHRPACAMQSLQPIRPCLARRGAASLIKQSVSTWRYVATPRGRRPQYKQRHKGTGRAGGRRAEQGLCHRRSVRPSDRISESIRTGFAVATRRHRRLPST